jgi:hypothetical protein
VGLEFKCIVELCIYNSHSVYQGYNRDTCMPMFITALFTTAKLQKQPRCSKTDERIKKIQIYKLFIFLLSHKEACPHVV